jgi:hypothetical protein
MGMLNRVSYFNIIVALIYLATLVNTTHIFSNSIFFYGFILTIGYNWTTIRILLGQAIRWERIIPSIGIITLLFGILMMVDGVYKVVVPGGIDEMKNGLLFLAVVDSVFGSTVAYQAIRTLRLKKATPRQLVRDNKS